MQHVSASLVNEFEWDVEDSAVVTQYKMDRLAKLEEDDPDMDVRSIDELR